MFQCNVCGHNRETGVKVKVTAEHIPSGLTTELLTEDVQVCDNCINTGAEVHGITSDMLLVEVPDEVRRKLIKMSLPSWT